MPLAKHAGLCYGVGMAKKGTKANIERLRRQGRIGGDRRALALSAERRKEIARNAAQAGWAKRRAVAFG